MMKKYLEAGKIVNTHGTRGEIKILPWADSADFLRDFDTFYIDGKPVRVLSSKIHKGCLIAALEGVCDISSAIPFKSKLVFIDRNDASLPEGSFFIQDIIGLPVITEDGAALGTLKDVISLPSNGVYVVEGEREYLIPDVPEFIPEKNLKDGYIKVRLIEGM